MFAKGRQSHVSSVDAVTLRHAHSKLKHLAVHWANQTASDGVRQAHGMPPMERTQLSREQSECLFGLRAGIRVSGAGTPNTKIIISCTVCRGFTLWSKHNQAWRLRKILVKLKNMLSRNMTCKNNPRRSRESMSPGTGSKLIVGNLELVGPFRQEGQGVHLRRAG